jgi:hypothetical protein
MSTIEYPNRLQRKSQLARYAIALLFSLLSKRVNGSAGWRDLLHVDSRGNIAMMHVARGWPCAESIACPLAIASGPDEQHFADHKTCS